MTTPTTPTLPVDKAALTKLLLLIENDVEALGWDQPARMYVVGGSSDDPQVELVAMVKAHPVEVFQQMFDDGLRLDEDKTLGIALCMEGWRYVDVEALEKNAPDLYAQVQQMTKSLLPDASEKELRAKMMEAWQQMLSRLGSPSQMPDFLRVENRQVVTVFRDGTQAAVFRDRGAEPIVSNVMGPEVIDQARIPAAMYAFLHGERAVYDR